MDACFVLYKERKVKGSAVPKTHVGYVALQAANSAIDMVPEGSRPPAIQHETILQEGIQYIKINAFADDDSVDREGRPSLNRFFNDRLGAGDDGDVVLERSDKERA
jgi:hypothetical protein